MIYNLILLLYNEIIKLSVIIMIKRISKKTEKIFEDNNLMIFQSKSSDIFIASIDGTKLYAKYSMLLTKDDFAYAYGIIEKKDAHVIKKQSDLYALIPFILEKIKDGKFL